MTDIEAFVKGLKPTLTLSKDQLKRIKLPFDYADYALHEFPQAVVFFRSLEERDNFSKEMAGVKIPSREYHYHLGLVSGFPPLAIEFFCDYCENPYSLEKELCYFKYVGRHFCGRYSDVVPICDWLWENVDYQPSPVEIIFNNRQYLIHPGIVCVSTPCHEGVSVSGY